jgi:hypothetical protein
VVVNYGGEAIHTERLMAILAEENDIRCEIYLSEMEFMSISFDNLTSSSQMSKSSQGGSRKFSWIVGPGTSKIALSGEVKVSHPKFQDTIPGQVGPKLCLAYNGIRNERGTRRVLACLFDVEEMLSYFMANDYIY